MSKASGNAHTVVLCQRTGGLLLRREADKSESAGVALLVAHDLGAVPCMVNKHEKKGIERGKPGDGTELLEGGAQLVVIEVLVKVLHVQVDTTGAVLLFLATALVLTAQVVGALALLHGTSDIDNATTDLLVVQLLDGTLGALRLCEAHEAEAAGLVDVRGIAGQHKRRDLAEGLEELRQVILVGLTEVLDEDVLELVLDAAGLLQALIITMSVGNAQ